MEEVDNKIAILDKAKKRIKEQFVGIDDTIDKIFIQLKIWYLYHDLLPAPVIINLFGINGVGKTDLINRIGKELNLSDKIMHISMSAAKNRSFDSHLTTCLIDEMHQLRIPTDSLGIILLDDLHNFKTIDDNNETLINRSFNDIWDFLSDGSLNYDNIDYSELKNMKKQCEFILEKAITKRKRINEDRKYSVLQIMNSFNLLTKENKSYVLSKLPNFENMIKTTNQEEIDYINRIISSDKKMLQLMGGTLYLPSYDNVERMTSSNNNPASYEAKETLYKKFISIFKPTKKDLDNMIEVKRKCLFHSNLKMAMTFNFLSKNPNFNFNNFLVYHAIMNNNSTNQSADFGTTTPNELSHLITARKNEDTYEFIYRLTVYDLYLMIEKRLTELKNKVVPDKKRVMTNFIVFTTGNLDVAFEEVNSIVKKDPKEYIDKIYDLTKNRINNNDIRNNLLKLFKPEQVARLTSNYIICHTLSYDDYKTYVSKMYNEIIDSFKKQFNDFTNEKTIDDLFNEILNECQWDPLQGIRALRSSITLIANNHIIEFLNKRDG